MRRLLRLLALHLGNASLHLLLDVSLRVRAVPGQGRLFAMPSDQFAVRVPRLHDASIGRVLWTDLLHTLRERLIGLLHCLNAKLLDRHLRGVFLADALHFLAQPLNFRLEPVLEGCVGVVEEIWWRGWRLGRFLRLAEVLHCCEKRLVLPLEFAEPFLLPGEPCIHRLYRDVSRRRLLWLCGLSRICWRLRRLGLLALR